MKRNLGLVRLAQEEAMYLDDGGYGGGGMYSMPHQEPQRLMPAPIVIPVPGPAITPPPTVLPTQLPTTMPLNYDCNTPQCMSDMLFKEVGLDASDSSGSGAFTQSTQPIQTQATVTSAEVAVKKESAGGMSLVWLLLGGYVAIQLASGMSKPKGSSKSGGLSGVPKKQTRSKPKSNANQRPSGNRKIVL